MKDHDFEANSNGNPRGRFAEAEATPMMDSHSHVSPMQNGNNGQFSRKRNLERLLFFVIGAVFVRWTMTSCGNNSSSQSSNNLEDPLVDTQTSEELADSGDDVSLSEDPLEISAKEAKSALKAMGQQMAQVAGPGNFNFRRCTLAGVGVGYGEHKLCDNLMNYDESGKCLVYSFGINNDYTFDLAVQNKTGCEVIGMDPTVHHPAMLGPHVRFYEWGAPGLFESKTWKIVPVSQVAREVKLEDMPVKILKMDCEGCEYKLYEDIAKNDPGFFNRIDQFAVEVHVSKYWMSTEEHALNYGRLLALLRRSGLRLMHARAQGCAQALEKQGCHSILKETGYLCMETRMCQNLLFARA